MDRYGRTVGKLCQGQLDSLLIACRVIFAMLCHMTEPSQIQAWIPGPPPPPPPPNPETYAGRLELIRSHMGWNIKEAARECGVPAATWRLWEVEGALPRNLVTISMAIASRTNVDLDWLVYGPQGKTVAPNGRYVDTRVIARIAPTSTSAEKPSAERRSHLTRQAGHTSRPVSQTRPVIRDTRRPFSAISR